MTDKHLSVYPDASQALHLSIGIFT